MRVYSVRGSGSKQPVPPVWTTRHVIVLFWGAEELSVPQNARRRQSLKRSQLVCKSHSWAKIYPKDYTPLNSVSSQTTLTSLERVDAVLLLAGQDDHSPAELATSGHLLTTEHNGLNPHRNQSTSQNIRSCAATQSGRQNVTSEDGSPCVTAGKQSQQGGVSRPGYSGTVKLTDPGLWLNLLSAVKLPDLVGSGRLSSDRALSFGWFTL